MESLAPATEESSTRRSKTPPVFGPTDDIVISESEEWGRDTQENVPVTHASAEPRWPISEAPSTDRPAEGSLAYEETIYGRRPPRAAAERVGSMIAGRYRLLSVLGEGGMGTVFEASHVDLGKRVAIKILSGLFAGHDEAKARFLREARVASAVESEHIAQVFDVGEDLDAGLYMVMELLKGEDLAARIVGWGRLRSEEAAGIALQVTRALERAHAAGIVHRDLKPANVFLARADDGSIKVKVLDFGIAKLVRDAQGSRGGITKRGTAVGTPQYMSPEQAQGLSTVDAPTDVYSLGALLHECVTGIAPYPELASYEQTILKIMMEDPPRVSSLVPDIEPAMDRLVTEMMAREPSARPTSFADVRARLSQIHPALASTRLRLGLPLGPLAPATPAVRTGGGVTVESSDPARRTRGEAPKRANTPIAIIGALAALITVTLVVLLVRSSADKPAPAVAASAPSEPAPYVEAPPDLTAAISPMPVATPPATAGVPVPAAPATGVVNAGAPTQGLPPAAPPQRTASSAAPVVPAAASAAGAPSTGSPSLVAEAQRALDHGDTQRAIALAITATMRTPTDAEAWLTLGAAYDVVGNHGAARRTYVTCATRASGGRVQECAELARE